MMFKKKREEERVSGQKGENKSNRIRTTDALSHALVLIFVLIFVILYWFHLEIAYEVIFHVFYPRVFLSCKNGIISYSKLVCDRRTDGPTD